MTRRALAALAVVALVLAAAAAFTATNTVPDTQIGASSRSIGADDLKPASCAGITLGAIVIWSNGADGTAANDLVLGTSGADDIRGRNGNDCILGGGGDDQMHGDAGTDVCVGGPGTDQLNGDCETAIQ